MVLEARNAPQDLDLSVSSSANPSSSSSNHDHYAPATNTETRANSERDQDGTKERHFVLSCDRCRESKLKCDTKLPRCSFCERQENQCTYTKMLTLRSCDACRKRKLRCYGNSLRCHNCEKSNTQCLRASSGTKRAPPKNAKYVSDLEKKLASVENSLRSKGLLIEVDGKVDLDLTEQMLHERRHKHAQRGLSIPILPSTSRVSLASTRNARARCTAIEIAAVGIDTAIPPVNATQMSDDLFSTSKISTVDRVLRSCAVCCLPGLDCSTQWCDGNFINIPSCCTITAQRVRERVGVDECKNLLDAAHMAKESLDHWNSGAYSDLFTPRTFVQLPDKQTCFVLLQEFFEDFQPLYPIFHKESFMNQVHRHYDSNSCHDISFWASLNAILAIAYRMRVVSHPGNANEDRRAWDHFQNAITAASGFIVRSAELAFVQTFLALTLFLQGTQHYESSRSLLTSAIRTSQSMGLHRVTANSHLDNVTVAQQRIVFWIAYILDKRMCLHSGLPAAQNDDDMDINLPTEESFEILAAPCFPMYGKNINLFQQWCKFARIQGQVYKQLYTAKALHCSTAEISRSINELDEFLQEWRNGTHEDFRPGHKVKVKGIFLHAHVSVLHLAYYNCLTLVHCKDNSPSCRTFGSNKSDWPELQDEQWYHRNATSGTICLNAVRASISLVRNIPLQIYTLSW